MTEADDKPDGVHAEHRRLLAAVMTGDLDPGAAAAAPLVGCAQCSRQLARLRGLTALLDDAGAEQRAILADAAREDPTPSLPARRRRWPLWLAAAAVVAVTWLLADRGERRTSPPPDDMQLQGNGDEGSQPVGEVKAFTDFRWLATPLAPGERFRVEVVPLDAEGAPVVGAEPVIGWTEANSWAPSDAADRARLAAWRRIEWRVFRATGRVGGPLVAGGRAHRP